MERDRDREGGGREIERRERDRDREGGERERGGWRERERGEGEREREGWGGVINIPTLCLYVALLIYNYKVPSKGTK